MKALEADEQEAGAVSSARLERLLHTQEVGGSSPPPPTTFDGNVETKGSKWNL